MLVDQEERAWLVDFGTSKSGDEMFDVIGESTPRYSSSATGNAFTWTSEVYPLGLILKELFTGPANRENSPEASFVNEILDGIAQPEFPNSVPAELQTICAKSLQQRRVDAYISAGEFADDLRSFVADTVATGNLENRLMGGENRVAAWRAGRFVGEATRFQEQTTVTLDSIKEHGLTDVATQLVNQLVVSGVGFREAVVLASRYLGRFGVILNTQDVASAFQMIVYRHGRLSDALFKEVETGFDELKSILNEAISAGPENLLNYDDQCLPAYKARLSVEQALTIGEDQQGLAKQLGDLFGNALNTDDFLSALNQGQQTHSLLRQLDRLDRRAERLLKKNG